MPAVSRFGGLFSLALVACWTATPPTPTTPSAPLESQTHDITGSYWCSIDEDGYEYPRYACMIKKTDDGLVLAKLAGSQRIRGQITLDSRDGFAFVGEMYCPDGDCQQELHGSFKPVGRGGFKGKFREETLIVHLTPAPANAFGGSAYGGDAYGDPFDLDGMGGATYGNRNYRIDSRGRRRP